MENTMTTKLAWNIDAAKRCMADKEVLEARTNLARLGKAAPNPKVQGYSAETIENLVG